MMKYRIYRSGPDDASTYSECWGAGAASRGSVVAETFTAEAARRAVAAEGSWAGLDAYEIRCGRYVSITIDCLRAKATAERKRCPSRTVWQ